MIRAIRGDEKVHRTWTIDGKIFCSLKSNQQHRIRMSTPEHLFAKLDWTEGLWSFYKLGQSPITTLLIYNTVHIITFYVNGSLNDCYSMFVSLWNVQERGH